MARTARIELRAEPEREERIRVAAELAQQSMSSFVLDAADRRAEEIIAATTTTVVPDDFFESLNAALALPPTPNEALAAVARRGRQVTQA